MPCGRKAALALLLALPALGACAPKGPQRPPELAEAHRRIEQRPNDGDAYLDLARYYFAERDLLRARQYLEVAERLHVKDPAARLRLALSITIGLGLYDDAVARIRVQLDKKDDTSLRLLLATVLEGMGRHREAELERRLVQEARPDDAHLLLENARFYQRWRAAELGRARGRGEALPSDPRAVALLQRCLELAPKGPDAEQARAALRAMELQSEKATAAAVGRQP